MLRTGRTPTIQSALPSTPTNQNTAAFFSNPPPPPKKPSVNPDKVNVHFGNVARKI